MEPECDQEGKNPDQGCDQQVHVLGRRMQLGDPPGAVAEQAPEAGLAGRSEQSPREGLPHPRIEAWTGVDRAWRAAGEEGVTARLDAVGQGRRAGAGGAETGSTRAKGGGREAGAAEGGADGHGGGLEGFRGGAQALRKRFIVPPRCAGRPAYEFFCFTYPLNRKATLPFNLLWAPVLVGWPAGGLAFCMG